MASVSLRAAVAVLLTLVRPAAAASVSICSGEGCAGRTPLEPGGQGSLSLGPDPDAEEFEAYAKSFERKYTHDSKEYWLRRGLFEKRNAAVKAHNAKLDRLWQAVAGPFADYTEEERASMRGYRRALSHGGPSSGGAELPPEVARARELLRPTQGNVTMPTEFDWLHLRVAHQVPDQGHCGSCWAVAAKSVLDAHYEIYVSNHSGGLRQFSAQQIVTCVPNPRACGGTGGCEGSTVELAFDWVLHNGCATEHQVPYQGDDLTESTAKCNESKLLSLDSHSLYGSSHSPSSTPENGGASFGMQGYHMLERNKEMPLKQALYQHGPIATSTAADQWYEYSSGVFNDCPDNVVVDHAVTLYGYGEAHVAAVSEPLMPVVLSSTRGDAPRFQSQVKKYWLIRNSWGKSWGEQGFIRMLRYDEEGKHCGSDNDNQEGTGCKGDNKTVTVCGMCGFLWDSVVPHFHAPVANSSLAVKTQVELDSSAKFVRREKTFHKE